MTKRVLGLIVSACLGGAALAACSSGTPTASTSSTTSSSTTTAASTSSTTEAPSSTTSTTAASSTTTTAGTTRCATGSLHATVYGSSGAAGTIETTVSLTSSASTPCTLGGYPGLQMLSSSGASLPTTVVRGGNYSFTSMAPSTITLNTGQVVYFNLGYSDVPSGSETSCPTSANLEITPPNAYDHLTIAAQLEPCNNGTIAVSPVFLATGANAATMAPAS